MDSAFQESACLPMVDMYQSWFAPGRLPQDMARTRSIRTKQAVELYPLALAMVHTILVLEMQTSTHKRMSEVHMH